MPGVELWTPVPPRVGSLLNIVLEHRYRGARFTRLFFGRVVRDLTLGVGLGVIVWAAICKYSGHFLSGTMEGDSKKKMEVFIQIQENITTALMMYELPYTRQPRIANGSDPVSYVYTSPQGQRCFDSNLEDFRRDYLSGDEVVILDPRPAELPSEPPAKKRRAVQIKNLAPAEAPEWVHPRIKGASPGQCDGGVPILCDQDYYWAAVTKWRSFNTESVVFGDVDNRHTNLPLLAKIPRNMDPIAEQIEFCSFVLDTVRAGLTGVRVVALTGPAGSGKTVCLDRLRELNILYVAVKGQLVQDINKMCEVSTAITWAKLGLTITGMSYYQWIMFTENLTQVTPEMTDSIFTEAVCDKFTVPEKALYLLATYQVLYIDEFSMINYGEMVFVLTILRKLGAKMLVVLVGDPAQIPPIKSNFELENAKYMMRLAERNFELHRQVRFGERDHATLMERIRNLVLAEDSFGKLVFLVEKRFKDLIPLGARFDIPIYYPEELCPQLRTEMAIEGVPLMQNERESVVPSGLIDLILSHKYHPVHFADFSITNAEECFAWLDKYHGLINNFVVYNMTNLNTHRGALLYAKALHQMCGAPVYFCKMFTQVQTGAEKRPFFGEYGTDRVQLLPLIVGHDYFFMGSGTIIKKWSRVTLVHVAVGEGGRCRFVIVVDQYRVFFKINILSFNMPLFCSSRANYTSNFPETLQRAAGIRLVFEMYGIPLMLACFSNIYQSQGATIKDKSVYLNLRGCTPAAMYVGLSRCCQMSQIKSVIL